MNEHTIRKMLEGGGGLTGAALRSALYLPGKAYGMLMQRRRAMYAEGKLSAAHAGVPVISIGNITAGGSGKTPFVILLARHLIKNGLRPGILLRGYRESLDGLSDEAILYTRACPEAIVKTGADRCASAKTAVEEGANILLLDDGFQHLRLHRDVDIVLVDATSPWGGGNTIPGGLLREPLGALQHADVVLVTRSDQAPASVPAIRKTIANLTSAPVFTSRHAPVRLESLDREEIPLAKLAGRPVVALAGIARPEAFCRTLESLGAKITATVAGKDHDHFTPDIVQKALILAKKAGGIVVTTEKDRAKRIFGELAEAKTDNYNVWTLGVEQEVDGLNELLSHLQDMLRRAYDKG